uniref:26S proteasome complex subunit dss-1 n=1 Tax=Trichuris muris TaxID=70415 RepID=A0A5S6QTV8_TRIMR
MDSEDQGRNILRPLGEDELESSAAESCFSLLQDDDEFEEFPDDECMGELDEQEALDPSVWDENWESEMMEGDFAKQLRAELEKLKAKIDPVEKKGTGLTSFVQASTVQGGCFRYSWIPLYEVNQNGIHIFGSQTHQDE